jgi:hypothetical protein
MIEELSVSVWDNITGRRSFKKYWHRKNAVLGRYIDGNLNPDGSLRKDMEKNIQ